MAPGKTPTFADRRANRKSTSSSSRLISVTHARRSATGHLVKTSRTLTSAQVREEKRVEEEREALRLAAGEQLRERNAWLDVPDSFDDEDTAVGGYEDDILHGRVAAEISHAGEGVQEEAAADSQTLLEKLRAHHNLLFAKRRDTRNRNNRTQHLVDAFAAQMEQMTDAYMAWSLASAEEGLGKLYKHPEDAVVEERTPIYVVDLFSAYYADVPLVQGERFVASAYVGQGLMPAAPYSPNVAITVRTLEIF